mmetsp:Transcript_9884/g.14754  ORF Transcript_9884/g.14754 Transcript_9884/m.14754 type:complete len:251 (-) Transcript_9884:1511-2263(-)
MSGAGTGYDLSTTTYNPEGKIFQVEYAVKATENGYTIVGLKCKDGILVAGEKSITSRMLVQGSNKISYGLTKHAGAIITGVVPDGRAVMSRARQEAVQYQQIYSKEMGPKVLSDRIAQFMQLFTSYPIRPFGSVVIVAGLDGNEPKLFMVDPSGNYYQYYACSAGKGHQICKTEMDKLDLSNMTCRETVFHLAKMLVKCRGEGQEKLFEIEMSWMNQETGYCFVPVPRDLLDQEIQAAEKALEDEEMGED